MTKRPKDQLTNSPDITIFFNPGCPYCHMALEFCANELPDTIQIAAIELGPDTERARQQFLESLNECDLGGRGIPLIIVGGKKCFQGFGPDTGAEIKRALADIKK
jgi:glutaredoxin